MRHPKHPNDYGTRFCCSAVSASIFAERVSGIALGAGAGLVMWHPLQLIPEGKVRWLSLALFALLFVLAVIWWKESTGSLKTSAAPHGIVSLELANK